MESIKAVKSVFCLQGLFMGEHKREHYDFIVQAMDTVIRLIIQVEKPDAQMQDTGYIRTLLLSAAIRIQSPDIVYEYCISA